MAKRLLSNVVARGIANSIESRVVSSPFFGRSLKYSTKISGDSDTHEDFRPANKLEGSGFSVHDVVQQDVKINPVMIYMKGVPDAPRCGFSALAVKVLQQYGVPISSRNILEDPILKDGVKAFSVVSEILEAEEEPLEAFQFTYATRIGHFEGSGNWPTFPQVFVKGEFIGGSDIVLSMHQNGQLKELLSDVNGGDVPAGDS